MKRKYVFLCGAVVGILIPLVLGINQYLTEGRYQLFFGKVMQLTVNPNQQFEYPVCFRLDTQTGETKIYEQIRSNGAAMDVWSNVPVFEEIVPVLDQLSSNERKEYKPKSAVPVDESKQNTGWQSAPVIEPAPARDKAPQTLDDFISGKEAEVNVPASGRFADLANQPLKQPLRRSPQLVIEPEAVIESQIDGDFEGWEGETIFKLTNGQIWQQASYDYAYNYAYMPEVIIYKTSGGYKMKVEDIEDVIDVVRIK
jgi:hypothetical protein